MQRYFSLHHFLKHHSKHFSQYNSQYYSHSFRNQLHNLNSHFNHNFRIPLYLCLYLNLSLSLNLILSLNLFPQTRNVFTSNSTSTTSWDSLSFGMLSRQVIVQLDSDNLNDTLWISFSSSTPAAGNSIMLLSKFQGEGIILNIQSRFIKTKASATLKRRIVVQ